MLVYVLLACRLAWLYWVRKFDRRRVAERKVRWWAFGWVLVRVAQLERMSISQELMSLQWVHLVEMYLTKPKDCHCHPK